VIKIRSALAGQSPATLCYLHEIHHPITGRRLVHIDRTAADTELPFRDQFPKHMRDKAIQSYGRFRDALGASTSI
jgi:hypothetical protein